MAVYMFIVIICYFAFSGFMGTFFDTFENIEGGEASDELANIIPDMRVVWTLFFALFAAVAPTWFIVWVFHREPDWEYRR